MQRDLRVLAGEEEDGDERHHGDQQDDVLDGEGADAEDVDLDQRRLRAQFDDDEDADDDQAGDDADPGARIAPPPKNGLLQAEDAQADAAGDEHGAEVVDRGLPVLGLGLGDSDEDQRDDGTGMFTQKMARQVHWVRKPPRIGPMAVSPPAMPKNRARAFPRSRRGTH